ncbi:MAG: hypothetical protein QME32_01755 [Endomicrobiia bacterium]|nr:hypothetical protein [Endomicrobiia bacterium]
MDIVESLSENQQESIIDILQHRLIEHKRESLAKTIKEAREQYSRGEIKKGAVDDLMKEIAE